MVVVRPRRPFVALALVVAGGVPLVLLKLAYDESFFDARIALVVLYTIVFVAILLRARLDLRDGTLRRPILHGRGGVQLDELAAVSAVRARFWRREGAPVTVVRIIDRAGRMVSFKPLYWRRRAGPLLAVVAACVRAQGVSVDDRTQSLLDASLAAHRDVVPAWAYRPPKSDGTRVDGAPPAVLASTFWTRRNPDGTPKKAQLQRLVPLVAALALLLPFTFVTTTAGTKAVRSLRCGHDKAMWGAAAEVVASDDGVVPFVFRVNQVVYAGTKPVMYRLSPQNLANSHNTPAVQRDAATLVDGFVAVWSSGNEEKAEVQVEHFPTHAAALAFQRDYGDDHCHGGDVSFHTAQIAGGVGFRSQCYRCSQVTDRVSFVRGTTRVQSIVWRVRSRDGHGDAIRLAAIADGTLPPGSSS